MKQILKKNINNKVMVENLKTETYFKNREKKFSFASEELREVAPFPKNALIELSNLCNHKCVFCKNSNQSRSSSQLTLDLFQKFISESVPLGLEEVGLYSTGEPFMTKDIEKYIALAKKLGVKRVYITTNGVLATLEKVIKCYDAGLDSIKFSINAGNANDYLKVHGYDDFNVVLRNVNDIYNWKINNNHHHSLQLLGSCVLIPGIKDTLKQHKEIFSKYFEDTQYVLSTSQGGQSFELPFNEEDKALVFGISKKRLFQKGRVNYLGIGRT